MHQINSQLYTLDQLNRSINALNERVAGCSCCWNCNHQKPCAFPIHVNFRILCGWGRQCGSENCGALQLRGQEFCYWVKDFLPTFALPVRPKINREGMVELPCQTHILLLVSTPNHSVCNQRHKYIRLHHNASKPADNVYIQHSVGKSERLSV